MADKYTGRDNTKALAHHGVLGMHWGIRRYQKADGTLTPEGKKKLARKEALRDIKRAKKSATRKGYFAGKTRLGNPLVGRQASGILKNSISNDIKVLDRYMKSKDPKVRKAATKAKKKAEKWAKHPTLRSFGAGTAQKATIGATAFGVISIVKALAHSEDEENYMDDDSDYLEHHGVKGMRWGIRRYQKYPAGKKKGKELVKTKKKVNEGPIETTKGLAVLKDFDQYSPEEIDDLIRRIERKNRLYNAVSQQSRNADESLKRTKTVTSILKDGVQIFAGLGRIFAPEPAKTAARVVARK